MSFCCRLKDATVSLILCWGPNMGIWHFAGCGLPLPNDDLAEDCGLHTTTAITRVGQQLAMQQEAAGMGAQGLVACATVQTNVANTGEAPGQECVKTLVTITAEEPLTRSLFGSVCFPYMLACCPLASSKAVMALFMKTCIVQVTYQELLPSPPCR